MGKVHPKRLLLLSERHNIQAAFHVVRPKYVLRQLGKIHRRRKENPLRHDVSVKENPLDG